MLITKQDIDAQYIVDPDAGTFVRRFSCKGKRAMTLAGGLLPHGYVMLNVAGKLLIMHRVMWFYVNGDWPPEDVDHVNGNRSDNRISNLRLATRSQNNGNSKRPVSNNSGFKGVSWHGGAKKWRATINVDKKQTHLGFFSDPVSAHGVYMKAAEVAFGKFARAE